MVLSRITREALEPVAQKFGGIYLLYCKPANLLYVGQTRRNFKRRWEEHLFDLERHRHSNKNLQAAYNEFGAKSIGFAILEVVTDPTLLDAREKWYIEKIGFANMMR